MMASLDGGKSLSLASDEVCQYDCCPCKDNDIIKGANHYCEDCAEYLCDSCRDYHRRFKMMKNHKILSGNKIPKPTTRRPASAKQNPEYRIYCSCSQGQEAEMYCETHEKIICNACKMIKHRKCKTASILDKCSSYTRATLKPAIEKAIELKNKVQALEQEKKSDLKKFATMKNVCEKEIKAVRHDLNAFLDRLEKVSLEELDTKDSQIRVSIQRQISTLETTLKAVIADSKELDDAEKSGEQKQMFAVYIKISKCLNEYESLIHDEQEETSKTSLFFDRNEQVSDFKRDLVNLGALTVIKEKQQPKTVSLLDMNVIFSNTVDIKGQDDDVPRISGCAFLSNGDLVMCDHSNSNLKVLDGSWIVKSSFELSSQPWDVAMINDKEAVITLPDEEKMQFVQIYPTMKKLRSKGLNKMCWGIHAMNEEIYVTCHNFPGEGEIRVFGLTGKFRRRIDLRLIRAWHLERPFYVSVSDSGKIFVSNDVSSGSAVTCLDADGTVVFQYKDTNMKGGCGIVVGGEDNIIICDDKSTKVHVIKATGTYHKTLFTSRDGIVRPYSCAFRHSDNTLVVGCGKGGKMLVAKLA